MQLFAGPSQVGQQLRDTPTALYGQAFPTRRRFGIAIMTRPTLQPTHDLFSSLGVARLRQARLIVVQPRDQTLPLSR